MHNEKPVISPYLYFLLLSSLTNLGYILAGLIVIALFAVQLSNPLAIIILILIIYKSLLEGFLTGFLYKRTYKKDHLVKFIGLYFGRFFGLFVGGLLGYKTANLLNLSVIIAPIVGALAFYFAGRWIGPKVSTWIGHQVDKKFSVKEIQTDLIAAQPIKLIPILFVVGFPLLIVGITFVFDYSNIPIDSFNEVLPIASIVAIILSALFVFSPWIIKRQGASIFQDITSSPESALFWWGVSTSMLPAGFGFILFFFVGASILETCFFAMASSMAGIFWIIKNPISSTTATTP